MPNKNQVINQYIRRQFIRKLTVAIVVALLFIGFMSYALYKEHAPVSEGVILEGE